MNSSLIFHLDDVKIRARYYQYDTISNTFVRDKDFVEISESLPQEKIPDGRYSWFNYQLAINNMLNRIKDCPLETIRLLFSGCLVDKLLLEGDDIDQSFNKDKSSNKDELFIEDTQQYLQTDHPNSTFQFEFICREKLYGYLKELLNKSENISLGKTHLTDAHILYLDNTHSYLLNNCDNVKYPFYNFGLETQGSIEEIDKQHLQESINSLEDDNKLVYLGLGDGMITNGCVENWCHFKDIDYCSPIVTELQNFKLPISPICPLDQSIDFDWLDQKMEQETLSDQFKNDYLFDSIDSEESSVVVLDKEVVEWFQNRTVFGGILFILGLGMGTLAGGLGTFVLSMYYQFSFFRLLYGVRE